MRLNEYSYVRPLNQYDYALFMCLDAQNPMGSLADEGTELLKDNPYEQDYLWGIFIREDGLNYGVNKLIGYCTVGGAEEVPGYKPGDVILSDVLISLAYRNMGYGTKLVSKVIEWIKPGTTIYITPWNDEVIPFYENMGFTKYYESMHYGDMMKYERK